MDTILQTRAVVDGALALRQGLGWLWQNTAVSPADADEEATPEPRTSHLTSPQAIHTERSSARTTECCQKK